MSDEDDDYMSDKFLCKSVINDVKPGLIKSYEDWRKFKILKRKKALDELHKKKNPNLRILEMEKRKEGLEKPIEETNKGFALLQKMGYKPGDGIGKSENGRTEPVSIELKSDREGLGRSQLRKEIETKQLRESSSNNVSTSEYRSRLAEQNLQRQIRNDLRKSQKVCQNLDAENNICEPVEPWYWLTTDLKKDEESQKRCHKKRKHGKYSHCKFGDSSESDCSNEENFSDDDDNDDDDADDDQEALEEASASPLNDDEKLKILTSYLREKYFFCIWCSVQYDSEPDMLRNCPGDSFQDH